MAESSAQQALTSIQAITNSLHGVANLDILGEELNKLLATHFPTDTWVLLTKDSNESSYVIRSAMIKNRVQRRLHTKEVVVKTGLIMAAVDNKNTIYIPVVKEDTRFDDTHDVVLGIEETAENAFLIPLVANDRKGVFGLLALYNVEQVKDVEYCIGFCEAVGSAIALVVDYLQCIRDLRREALTDHLTGLRNRRALVSIVEREIEQCLRYDRHMSFVLIDVDHFKSINDTDGHLRGDAVLVRLAQILLKSVRRLDYVIRFAGDEFIILMPDTLAPQKNEVMRRLRENFEQEKLSSSVEYSISIGSYSGPPQNLQHMFDKADKEMYRQKKEHKRKAKVATARSTA